MDHADFRAYYLHDGIRLHRASNGTGANLWPEHRSLVLVVAAVSKLVFVGLVLSIGTQFLGKAGLTIAFDGTIALIFILYLLGPKNRSLSV